MTLINIVTISISALVAIFLIIFFFLIHSVAERCTSRTSTTDL